MQGVHLRKYGVAAKIDFVLYEVDGVDFRTDWTPAAGDVFMMRDEAAEEQVTNAAGNADLSTLVTDEGRGYSITLALEDMQAARIAIYLVDQATKAFLDWPIIIETYGNTSAQHAFDLDTAQQSINVTQIDGNATNGNNATLNLKQLNIVNSAGSALIASSTGSSGNGLQVTGNGSGQGLYAEGGATGVGIAGVGGVTSGAGIYGAAQNNDDAGMQLVKNGSGKDIDADEIAAIPTTAMRGTDNAALASGVNVTQISSDSNAADNLEATFDGTGYSNPEAPAKQSQLSSLANVGAAINKPAGEDNTGGAIKGVAFIGSQTNTYAAAEAIDGTYHKIDDAADAIDIVYGFDVGGDGIPTQLNMTGFLNGVNDELKVFGYDFVDSDWVQIGIVVGKTITTNDENTYPMFVSMVGTIGSDLGKVYIRFQNTGQSDPDLNIDQLFISYAVVRRSVGYSDGAIWVDTINGTAGTENYVNGTADNPVLTWADALTLSTAIGIKRFHIVNGSVITLSADSSNLTIEGHEYSLALNGQECLGLHVIDAEISGTGKVDGSAGTAMHFVGCCIGDVSLDKTNMRSCAFIGTITITDSVTYIFDSCFAADTGGASPPEIDMDDKGATVGLRDYSGGIKVKTMSSSDKFTVQGTGKVTIDATCDDGGTIGIHGNMTLLDNVGSFAGTLNDDSRIDVDQINAECDSALSDYGANTVVPDVAGTAATPAEVATELNTYGANKTTPPTTGQIKTALEADGSKLDHLHETTEDDGGVRRFTENALEEAPSGAGLTATQNTALILIRDIMEGDATIDISTTPWQLVIKKKSTSTEVLKKNLKDVNGVNIAAVTTVIGQQLEP